MAKRRGAFLTALLSCAFYPPLFAQQNTDQGSPKQCSSSQGGFGVSADAPGTPSFNTLIYMGNTPTPPASICPG